MITLSTTLAALLLVSSATRRALATDYEMWQRLSKYKLAKSKRSS